MVIESALCSWSGVLGMVRLSVQKRIGLCGTNRMGDLLKPVGAVIESALCS